MSEGGGDLFQHFAERNVNRRTRERENLSSTRLYGGGLGFPLGSVKLRSVRLVEPSLLGVGTWYVRNPTSLKLLSLLRQY